MKLYLDDDSVHNRLVISLRKAGHTVDVPGAVGLSDASDAKHFAFAISRGFVVLTRNHDDFKDLHDVVMAAGGRRPGILVVCSDNDPQRDMKVPLIVRAIAKFVSAGAPLATEFIILNHWR